jgi:hypothetical protein
LSSPGNETDVDGLARSQPMGLKQHTVRGPAQTNDVTLVVKSRSPELPHEPLRFPFQIRHGKDSNGRLVLQ